MRLFFNGLFIFSQASFEDEEIVELPILNETSLAKMKAEKKKALTSNTFDGDLKEGQTGNSSNKCFPI